MKESIFVDLDGAPPRYREYIRMRNNRIGGNLSFLIGGTVDDAYNPTKDTYYLPATTQNLQTHRNYGVRNIDDMYGTAVEDIRHVDKSILHEVLDRRVPSFYSSDFARSIKPHVLPGFTAFSCDAAHVGFDLLTSRGYRVRSKPTQASDGNGQVVIGNHQKLDQILDNLEGISDIGLVLEANLFDPLTTSVGFVHIAGKKYSFLSKQIDHPRSDGTSEYRGGRIKMVRGDMSQLLEVTTSEVERRAVEATRHVYDAYSHFSPLVSRISFDYVADQRMSGPSLEGITDITGRLGGTCPAIMQGALAFERNPALTVVHAEVHLNYLPSQRTDYETDAHVYIDEGVDPSVRGLRITAKVTFSY